MVMIIENMERDIKSSTFDDKTQSEEVFLQVLNTIPNFNIGRLYFNNTISNTLSFIDPQNIKIFVPKHETTEDLIILERIICAY